MFRNLCLLLTSCKVWRFHICVADDRVLVWCAAVSVGNVTLRFDGTCCFHLQEQSSLDLLDWILLPFCTHYKQSYFHKILISLVNPFLGTRQSSLLCEFNKYSLMSWSWTKIKTNRLSDTVTCENAWSVTELRCMRKRSFCGHVYRNTCRT